MNTILGTFNKGESSRTFDRSSICGLLQSGHFWTLWWFPLQVSRSCSAAVLQCPGSVAAGRVDRQRWRAASQKSVRKEGCDAGWAARETIHRQTSLFLLSLTWKFRRWLLCLNDYNLIQHESLLRIYHTRSLTSDDLFVSQKSVLSYNGHSADRATRHTCVTSARDTWHVTLACDGVISRPGPGRKRSGVLVELSVI